MHSSVFFHRRPISIHPHILRTPYRGVHFTIELISKTAENCSFVTNTGGNYTQGERGDRTMGRPHPTMCSLEVQIAFHIPKRSCLINYIFLSISQRECRLVRSYVRLICHGESIRKKTPMCHVPCCVPYGRIQ